MRGHQEAWFGQTSWRHVQGRPRAPNDGLVSPYKRNKIVLGLYHYESRLKRAALNLVTQKPKPR